MKGKVVNNRKIINEEYIWLMKKEIADFLKILEEKYLSRNFSPEEYDDVLFFCVQLLDCQIVYERNDLLEKTILYILEKIREQLYLEKTPQIQLKGAMKGIGLLCYSTRILCIKRKNVRGFEKLFNLLDDLFCEVCRYRLNIIKKAPLFFSNYDLVSGMSGNLHYLLLCENQKREWLIKDIMNYLVGLTEYETYKGMEIIKFHIHREEQYAEKERREMKNGNINFGLAHGMVSVLLVLSECKYYGYYVDGLDDAIEKILNLYQRYALVEENILKFPTQLSFEGYVRGKNIKWSFNAGWCYGNAGIVQALMRSMYYLGRTKEEKYYIEMFYNILNQEPDNYSLETPILCHGYASIVAMQVGVYNDTGQMKMLDTLERNIAEMLKEHENFKKISEYYSKDFSILQGSAGVILTLIDTLNKKMEYKYMMMISKNMNNTEIVTW